MERILNFVQIVRTRLLDRKTNVANFTLLALYYANMFQYLLERDRIQHKCSI